MKTRRRTTVTAPASAMTDDGFTEQTTIEIAPDGDDHRPLDMGTLVSLTATLTSRPDGTAAALARHGRP